MYQTGQGLSRPPTVPIQTFVRELCFYDLGEDVLQTFLDAEGMLRENVVVPKRRVQKFIWSLFEASDGTVFPKAIAFVNVIMVLLAIINFCVQTVPEFQPRDLVINGTVVDNLGVRGERNSGNPFFVIETICTTWFTVDLVVRFIVSPVKKAFCLHLMNVIDVLSILPYFVDLTLSITDGENFSGTPTKILFLTTLRILRVIKIFRVFKLVTE